MSRTEVKFRTGDVTYSASWGTEGFRLDWYSPRSDSVVVVGPSRLEAFTAACRIPATLTPQRWLASLDAAGWERLHAIAKQHKTDGGAWFDPDDLLR